MDLLALLSPEIQAYIDQNIGTNLSQLALQKNPFPAIDFKLIINQIEAKAKSRDKLPTWFNTQNILYPAKISIEQTSSEITAQYKAHLVNGNSLIDLTGGFGVDDYYFSKKMNRVVHCEINTELGDIVQYNFQQLQAKNISCYAGDSLTILQQLNQKFDWMYIDPSRRSDSKGKVFMLKDCLPNVPQLLHTYLQYSSKILIKTAPILDISAGLAELDNVTEIHIIAVENEVKELLWLIDKEADQSCIVKTINLTKGKQQSVDFSYPFQAVAHFDLPKKYLFEPNAALMKSGAFDEIAVQFSLSKLNKNAHLYTSASVIDFPGRVFEIKHCIDFNKKNMKAFVEGKQAHITVRHFPESVEMLRKKWKIKEGGDLYSFFTTNATNDKIVLLCAKIN